MFKRVLLLMAALLLLAFAAKQVMESRARRAAFQKPAREVVAAGTSGGAPAGPATVGTVPNGWNLETNAEGAVFHREGTNLWWVGGNLPAGPIPGVLNLPTEEDMERALAGAEAQRRQLEADFEALNLPPIVFYGVAVDEHTNAVAGATVRAAVVRHERGRNSEQHLELITGPDGRFTIEGVSGTALGVAVTKTNYHPAAGGYFKYSRLEGPLAHQPDPNRPVVFALTEVKEPQILVSFARGFCARNTGEPLRIDLTTGEIVLEGGDLVISITHIEPYNNLAQPPWTMTLEAVGGGFFSMPQDVPLERLYEAPNAEYSPAIEVDMQPGPDYRRQFNGVFYVATRSGLNFSKMRFDMSTYWDERGVPFSIHAFVNTNASRVLTADRERIVDLNRLKGWRPQ